MALFGARDPDEYLLPTERRVIRVRRHWASLGWDVFEACALLAIAVMVSYLIPGDYWLVQNVLWYGALIVVLRFVYQVLDWRDETIVVTDKRFLLTTGVFNTKVAMMPISKVTDLTYERTATGRSLGYGTLVVESAGQIQALNRIEYLPRPEEVYDAISELVFGDKQAAAERFSMIKAQRLARNKTAMPQEPIRRWPRRPRWVGGGPSGGADGDEFGPVYRQATTVVARPTAMQPEEYPEALPPAVPADAPAHQPEEWR